MPKLTFKDNYFYWLGDFDDRQKAIDSEFEWFAIPGKKTGVWRTSDTEKAILLESFADDKAQKNITKYKKLIAKSRAHDSSLYIPAPEGEKYKPFQRAGVDLAATFLNDYGAAMFADDMGLGKTIETIGVLNFFSWVKVLVICPTSLILNWEKELKKWHYLNPKIEIICEGKQQIKDDSDILILPYSLASKVVIREQILKRYFQCIVMDEVHKLKNPKAQVTKSILGKLKSQSKKNPPLISRSDKYIPISGTPMLNMPIELYPLLIKIAPQVINYMSYIEYAVRYCGAYQGEFGWVINESSRESEFQSRLRSRLMIRRLKSEVLKELPEKEKQIIYFKTDKKTEKLIKEELDYERSALRKSKKQKIDFTEYSLFRHEIALHKLPLCIEHIKDVLESTGEKIVVFAHHKDVIKGLRKGLEKYNPLVIDGNVDKMKRQPIVDLFQEEPKHRIIIGELEAMGVGYTLTAARLVIFVEGDWVPSTINQCIDRVHRIGQENAVLAQFLVYENSLDAEMIRKNIVKQKNLDNILDERLNHEKFN